MQTSGLQKSFFATPSFSSCSKVMLVGHAASDATSIENPSPSQSVGKQESSKNFALNFAGRPSFLPPWRTETVLMNVCAKIPFNHIPTSLHHVINAYGLTQPIASMNMVKVKICRNHWILIRLTYHLYKILRKQKKKIIEKIEPIPSAISKTF